MSYMGLGASTRRFICLNGRGHTATALLSAALLCTSAYAKPARFECPQSIDDTDVHVAAPAGWQSFVSSPVYLNNAAPADGPPERLGVLRGDEEKASKTGWSHRYSLEGPYPEGKWLRCDYGAFGEIALAKRLPDDIKECTVSGRKGKHAGESIIQIVCQ